METFFKFCRTCNTMISRILRRAPLLLYRVNTAPFIALKKASLQATDMLVTRHIGPTQAQTQEMLKIIGVNSLDQLMQHSIPSSIRDSATLQDNAIGEAISEHEFLQKMRVTFSKNKLYRCYIGCGFYPTILPSVIQRNLLENPGWYTAYTPYQAEISQGRLQALINYQTMVQQITRLGVSNASLLDEASAGGEALYMSYNLHDRKRNKFFIDEDVFTTTKAVVQTKANYMNLQVIIGKYSEFLQTYDPQQFFGIMVQTPDSRGVLHDFTEFFGRINSTENGVTKVVASDLLALTLTKAPGDMGADICFGSSQRFGVPMGFGGPYSGFFASREQNIRKMPGRIIGRSIDVDNKMGYRMLLQTREQHIRRQKATSNVCTSQALLANIVGMYGVYHGPKGLKNIARRVNLAAQLVARIFEHYGFTLLASPNQFSPFFDTIYVQDCDSHRLNELFIRNGMNINVKNDRQISLSFSQLTKQIDLEEISRVLAQFTEMEQLVVANLVNNPSPFSGDLNRKDKFMNQKIFNSIHSESEMMRILRNLQGKDISLNRSMIPLGSCTMKLNAASEMIPLTWPQLNLHPFVPKDQAQGYHIMIGELREYLKSITQFDQISFQPNSGATGEYAGLLTINKYLQSIGQGHRKYCLIPKSAHGTNPASAILAGFKVVGIETIQGLVCMKDFKAKVQKFSENIGAFMITFPSTTGKYQDTIHQMIDTIHQHGGQVYMDGANMNAQVGYTSPGFLGADVCHLNLHKTFAIPHGGGGPGMGPIGVKKHLAPYLPTHPFAQNPNKDSVGTLTHAQFSSASILSISYAYIAMLGKEGIRKSTAYALLNANYLMKKLQPFYKIFGMQGDEKCSHQFIIDLADLKKKTGISEQDIAKRLMDYGFHAPTMSFPIPSTLMVEPTQSENKAELDRFAEAMIKIHEEMHTCPQILKHAPYTAEYLMKQNWEHKFSRFDAAYPLQWVRKRGKYWPPIRRISNPYGDRNLICACPQVSSWFQT